MMFAVCIQPVFLMTMIGNKIGSDRHSSPMHFVDKPTHIIPCTEMWIYLFIICYVISVISIGFIKGCEYYSDNSQPLYIVKGRKYAFQVSTLKAYFSSIVIVYRKTVYEYVIQHGLICCKIAFAVTLRTSNMRMACGAHEIAATFITFNLIIRCSIQGRMSVFYYSFLSMT